LPHGLPALSDDLIPVCPECEAQGLSGGVLHFVLAAQKYAAQKHGDQSILRLPHDFPGWLAILVEEVGEVANALTYDARDPRSLFRELLDVAAVACAWAAAIDGERVEHYKRQLAGTPDD
jgi:NTP pyrophosphatase (non-canonical NTP hydrolase)